MKLSFLLSTLLYAFIAEHTVADATSAPLPVASKETPESAWGRLYLRHGLAPIQYFRDRYGGPVIARELELYFPADRLGCELLPTADQDLIRASNGSMALVFDRGVCSFETKSRNAQQMGAAALIVISEDESAIAPVATADQGEIEIATVMIRKSAGDMLRLLSSQQRVFGQITPITCERNPYVCKPRTAAEVQYIKEQSARSGVVVARATNATLGDFLTANYGSVLPSGPWIVASSDEPLDGCESLDVQQVGGKVVLLSEDEGDCSTLEKVSNAQLAGASAVLIDIGNKPTAMTRPSVKQNWHAYNITIVVAAISSATRAKLTQLIGDPVEIDLERRNSIADAWDEVRRLSVKTAWPTRKDRKGKALKRVLSSFPLDKGQLRELKHNFMMIAGGSRAEWDQMLASLTAEDDAQDRNQGQDQGHAEGEQETNRDEPETVEVRVAAGGM